MQKVSLFGYGGTTKSLAKHIQDPIFYDDNCEQTFTDENGFEVRPSSEFKPENSKLEIPSPGIPPLNPLIQKANNLMSDYDFFASSMPMSIWISGTNGKTTTTQMMHHILKDRGALAGGNIGTALGDLDTKANMWILETSSFTMHYTNIASPNLYVLLPIRPDHLSWHGDMQEYENAKLKPLKTMKEGEIAIIPQEYKDTPTNAHIITYKNAEDLAQQFEIDTTKIKFKGVFLTNALLAMACDKILFDSVDYDKINSFVLDPHRQEELYDSKERLWVNDTKATNIDATLAALERYNGYNIHIILGGDDKGVKLDPLFENLINYNVKIYAIGSNKQKLANLACDFEIAIEVCDNLANAIERIDANLEKGEVALLSPAAASLDEFSSYAQRGNEFKEAVQQL